MRNTEKREGIIVLVDNRPVRGDEDLEIRARLLEISRFDRLIFKIYIVYRAVYKGSFLSFSLIYSFIHSLKENPRGSSDNCVC